jgi:hypothetical protein
MRPNFKNARVVAAVLCSALLGACGGGGTSESPPSSLPAIAPPSGLTYPAAPAWVVGQAITPLTPTVTGTVTSYTVTPALPAGLTLNTQTGTITGTPTAIAAAAAHTVTASNAGGSTTASVSVVVNDVPPVIAYGNAPLHLTTGVALNPITPTVNGGAPVSWRIEPALPEGLAFGATDGRITGTPIELAAAQSYLVTATNSGGQSQASLTINVESGVLLELGHAGNIERLRLSATRALSQDVAGHWVLWNLATREMLAQGDTECAPDCFTGHRPVDLAGATMVVEKAAGLELRTAVDGQILATVAGNVSSWKLATDGTYVVAANATALRAWASSGAPLFTRSGDYSHAIVFAAPTEVRVARGPAGNNAIEQIAVASGAASMSGAFLGDFHSWFVDGERFLTTVGATVRVYSSSVVQLDVAALPSVDSLTGQGTWFWILHFGTVQLYAVGASAAPAATYTYGVLTSAVASGSWLAVLSREFPRVRVVDLSNATPSSVEHDVPHGYLSTFGANVAGQWLLGTCCGVVLDGSTLPGPIKYYGYGAALSVAGSDVRAAIATASGRILLFNGVTRELEGTIQLDASHVELKSDGTLLAAAANANYAQYLPDRSLSFYALPARTLLDTRPYVLDAGLALMEMSLAASGGFVAENLYDSTTAVPTRRVTPVAGGAATFSETGPLGAPMSGPFRLSPNGHHIAVTVGTATNLYEDGSLIGAAPGSAVGWIDDGRLLLSQYEPSRHRYVGASITDPSGTPLATLPLPELPGIQPLGSDRAYAARQNAIFSLTTGSPVWTGSRLATLDLGAVAGPTVVFVSGTEVRAEPR